MVRVSFRLTIVWIRVDICQGESSEKDFVKKREEEEVC